MVRCANDSPYLLNIYGRCIVSKLYVIKRDMFIGDNMEKWKELGKRKKFWICVGVIAVIAVVGWVSGWWSSPPAV